MPERSCTAAAGPANRRRGRSSRPAVRISHPRNPWTASMPPDPPISRIDTAAAARDRRHPIRDSDRMRRLRKTQRDGSSNVDERSARHCSSANWECRFVQRFRRRAFRLGSPRPIRNGEAQGIRQGLGIAGRMEECPIGSCDKRTARRGPRPTSSSTSSTWTTSS